MILLFGPAGAGKSAQAQLLSERLGLNWISTGQMIRNSNNKELNDIIKTGALLSTEMMNKLLFEELKKYDGQPVVLDGYPRKLDQAKWLVENAPEYDESIDLLLMIDIPEEELMGRLSLRGRVDDAPDIIRGRLKTYYGEADAIIDYLVSAGIAVERINGVGSVEAVHDRVIMAMKQHNIV